MRTAMLNITTCTANFPQINTFDLCFCVCGYFGFKMRVAIEFNVRLDSISCFLFFSLSLLSALLPLGLIVLNNEKLKQSEIINNKQKWGQHLNLVQFSMFQFSIRLSPLPVIIFPPLLFSLFFSCCTCYHFFSFLLSFFLCPPPPPFPPPLLFSPSLSLSLPSFPPPPSFLMSVQWKSDGCRGWTRRRRHYRSSDPVGWCSCRCWALPTGPTHQTKRSGTAFKSWVHIESKQKKKPTHFSPVLFYKSLRKFHVASTSTKKSQERKTGQIARKY